MTAVPSQPPAVPDDLVERAADRIALHYGAKPPKRSVLLHHARIALAAVADDLRAEGRPPVCRDGCQVHAMMADAEQRRAEPGTRDDPMVLVERLGLGERFRAEARRECAAELRDPLRRLTSALIAVEYNLDKPYPDDPRWTPWTRFVEPALKAVRAVVDSWSTPARPADDEERQR